MMMKGREKPRRRSEKARLKMKMFLAVLMSLLLTMEDITRRLFRTDI